MSSPITVTLRTGVKAPLADVAALTVTVKAFLDSVPDSLLRLAILDLVMLCRDVSHELAPDTAAYLLDLSLVRRMAPGVIGIHDETREVLLAMFDGEGFDLQMVDPVQRRG